MIVWAGSQEDLGYRLLAAGTTEHVIAKSGDLGEVLSLREPAWSGVAVPPGTGALRLAENSDGLAKAVGFADTLAFAGGLPGRSVSCRGWPGWSRPCAKRAAKNIWQAMHV